jgi:hypothetical protein
MLYEFGQSLDCLKLARQMLLAVRPFYGRNSNPKYHPHVRKCSTYGQADAWLNRVNR